MKKIEALRSVNSIHGLAQLLGFKVGALNYILFKIPSPQKYRSFTIPKRSGGVRSISAPDAKLKALQKKVSTLLNDCLLEIEDGFSSPAHGFKPERSIFTNAACHRGRRYVLNLDLENFFPSIHFGRIAGYFEKSQHFNLNQKIARTLANILCHQSSLPQGAPSSPVASNLLARMLDIHLARLAKRNRLSYTRYADDITFSTSLSNFPENIAKKNELHEWELGEHLIKTIRDCGFNINHKKTRMLYKTSRQEVTGIVVNDQVGVPVEYRQWTRAAVDRLLRRGSYFDKIPKDFVGPRLPDLNPGSIDRLEGRLSHIYNAHRFRRRRAALGTSSNEDAYPLNSDESVYRSFLFYTKFFLADKAKIVCEGETDAIYLNRAISLMANEYPSLIDLNLNKGEKDRFKIRFTKHNEISGRLLELNGGTAALKNFCRIYVEQTKKFLAGTPSKPVIVVVDSDKAGKDVINYVKGIAKHQGITEENNLNYVFAHPNLYVVCVPNHGRDDAVIESLFSEDLLKSKLGGKVLNVGNKKSGDGEYGKMYFAKYIVPNASAGDVTGFKPLLNFIAEAIDDFKRREKIVPGRTG